MGIMTLHCLCQERALYLLVQTLCKECRGKGKEGWTRGADIGTAGVTIIFVDPSKVADIRRLQE